MVAGREEKRREDMWDVGSVRHACMREMFERVSE